VRVAKPGAVVFVSVMGYLAVLRTTMARLSDYMLDAEWQTLVQKGTVPIGNAGMVWHFFRADELRQEAERCGLTTLEMAGCEGLSAGLSEATNTLGQDETKWKQWVDLVVQTSAEPGVADMADHILYVGRASKA
jgi:hypothetical protein